MSAVRPSAITRAGSTLHAVSTVRASSGAATSVLGDGWCTGIPRHGLARRVERLEEGDEPGHLRRAQVLAVGRHLAATLQDLPDQLVPCEPCRDVVERGPAQTPFSAERMAVAALLFLDEQRALECERRAALQIRGRRRERAPPRH